MSGTFCFDCGTELEDIDMACPRCLPNGVANPAPKRAHKQQAEASRFNNALRIMRNIGGYELRQAGVVDENWGTPEASAGKPEAVAERRLHQEAWKRASEDREREYPVVTPENFEAADAFQKERAGVWKDAIAAEASS